MPSRLQPAFWGGLFIGVLSSLPFVSNLNACCCLWVIVGGVLTAYLRQERLPVPMTAGDGAVTGLLAGVIGAVIAAVLSSVLALVQGASANDAIDRMAQNDLPPEFGRVLDQMRDLPPSFWLIVPILVYMIVFPIFGTLGGLLGVAIFKRKTPLQPPPGTVDILPPE